MNITVCSSFRSSCSYLMRYFAQIAGLERLLKKRGDKLHLILGEGDHTDDTRQNLPAWVAYFDAEIVSIDHGGADYGSVVNADRFANIAKVCNAIWQRIPVEADVVLIVESDLQWHPDDMIALIDSVANQGYSAISPMVMLRRPGFPAQCFYDTWAARKDGWNIRAMPPYFAGWDMQTPIQVDSMGSCMAIQGDLARQLTWPADVFVGICRQIYALGGSVWIDPAVEVIHL